MHMPPHTATCCACLHAKVSRAARCADTQFYDSPRFVTHIDDRAIQAVTQYYDSQFPKDSAARQELAVLDMCSSWISHYPKGFSAGKVAGVTARPLSPPTKIPNSCHVTPARTA